MGFEPNHHSFQDPSQTLKPICAHICDQTTATKTYSQNLGFFLKLADALRVSNAASKTSRILVLIKERGVLRPRDLAELGIHPSNLSLLHRQGLVERSGRGLYTLADGLWTEHHSLVETMRRVPGCVIGLASALRFHELTNEMPHQVWIFISRKAWKPQVDYPSLNIFHCSPEQLHKHTVQPEIEGVGVCVTDVPRTIVDCFLHRRAIGMDVAILALKEVMQRRLCTAAELALVAKERRAWNTMRPYLEAIL